MIETSTGRVAIRQQLGLICSFYVLELNSPWDSVNLPVTFSCFFLPATRQTVSLIVVIFSVDPVTAESFNWVTTAVL